jgi:hypothetical protein
LPFPEFKWKWATNEPTEGLNASPVYLGVLRALHECEGQALNSVELKQKLAAVKSETDTKVNLARPTDRNLIRNSGQYWKAKGLLKPVSGAIALTDFGKRVATGAITRSEFAASVIQNYELPNNVVFSDAVYNKWIQAGIKIRPLNLILNIASTLADKHGTKDGYITTNELAKITVPLSATSTDHALHAEAIHDVRLNRLNVGSWPNCASGDNDLRILREFLMFLHEYGYLERLPDNAAGRFDEKYFLPQGLIKTIESVIITASTPAAPYESIVTEIRKTGIISGVERRRVQRTITERPGQDKFRKDILAASSCRCLLTGEKIPDVLEAAHIVPVEQKGSDHAENGLCLRSDIHTLFDSSHIRIRVDGEVVLTAYALGSPIYNALPKKIKLPGYVNADALKWRFTYQ